MANSTYVVRLLDCAALGGASGGVAGNAGGVTTPLTGWYSQICQRATRPGTTWTADVQWAAQCPVSGGTTAGNPITINMAIFFVPSVSRSVIKLHRDFRNLTLPSESDSTQTGYTVFRFSTQGSVRTPTLGISEVYVDRCRGSNDAETQLILARTGFHESMHNQLQLAGADLHRLGGFAGDPIAGSAPTPANVLSMANAISTLVPQWLAGCDAWNQAAHDPLGFL
jgi:hypothetical protein